MLAFVGLGRIYTTPCLLLLPLAPLHLRCLLRRVSERLANARPLPKLLQVGGVKGSLDGGLLVVGRLGVILLDGDLLRLGLAPVEVLVSVLLLLNGLVALRSFGREGRTAEVVVLHLEPPIPQRGGDCVD